MTQRSRPYFPTLVESPGHWLYFSFRFKTRWHSFVKRTDHRNEKGADPDAILQLGLAFLGSKTLLAAIELNLFTELAKGTRDKDTLRVQMGIHERSAEDFFDS